ncbi:MAG TPA: chorismate-binding protein [Galbitalea sp.]|jgi:anthranilate synthase component 1
MPRLVRTTLPHWVDPGAAFVALYGDATDVVWLDSGPNAITGRSYLGRAVRALTSGSVAPGSGSVIELLRAELAANRLEPTGDGFALGWVGWIGYESRFETMDGTRNRDSPYPDAAFLFLDRAIEFDHAARTVTLLQLVDAPEWRADVEDVLASATFVEPVPEGSAVPERPVWRDSDAEYLAKIRECQARIAAGDAYLLCLTNEVSVAASVDPVATYLALRAASPTHHGALVRLGDVSLLSASPEQFLTVSPSGMIESRPIKGTRPRGADPEQDAALAADLIASEKERAENLMIVDLMRNDIGSVSEIGSVEVPSLLTVESYAPVHQLVSTVRGQLAHGLEPLDAVLACFPAGSMTGTPKSSATRILDELEAAPRGIYSGAFGFFALDGRVDLAMVIRSIVVGPRGASIGAGGGITALSDPDEELAEVKLKAAALLRALGVG